MTHAFTSRMNWNKENNKYIENVKCNNELRASVCYLAQFYTLIFAYLYFFSQFFFDVDDGDIDSTWATIV